MRANWIRWVVGLQILFFVGWAGLEEYRGADAVEFLLETRPVDPRDFLSGLYMTLAYSAMDPPGEVRGREALVRLEFDREVTIGGQAWPVWRAVSKVPPDAVDDRRPSPTGGWAMARVVGDRLDYGIDRYYFSEARQEELNELRGGQFFVLVSLGQGGVLRVEDLVWETD